MATHSPTDYELLRRRCAALKDQNWPQVKIAQALGLTEGWVSQTLKKYRQDGLQALAWKKPAGPACRLNQQQLAQLVTELNKGALAHGFEGQVWTRQRVNAVITKLFGVSYDPSQVGRLLKGVGWSRQKPARQARHRTAEAAGSASGGQLAGGTPSSPQKKRKLKGGLFSTWTNQHATCCLSWLTVGLLEGKRPY